MWIIYVHCELYISSLWIIYVHCELYKFNVNYFCSLWIIYVHCDLYISSRWFIYKFNVDYLRGGTGQILCKRFELLIFPGREFFFKCSFFTEKMIYCYLTKLKKRVHFFIYICDAARQNQAFVARSRSAAEPNLSVNLQYIENGFTTDSVY